MIGLENSNEPKGEYLRMKALCDLNSSDYIVVDKTFNEDGNLSNTFRHLYRFPSKAVKRGEFIRLFTSKDYKKYTQDNGAVVHQFHWCSDQCIWNDKDRDEAFVYKISRQGSVKANIASL